MKLTHCLNIYSHIEGIWIVDVQKCYQVKNNSFYKAMTHWNANPSPLLVLVSLACILAAQSKWPQPHFLRNLTFLLELF